MYIYIYIYIYIYVCTSQSCASSFSKVPSMPPISDFFRSDLISRAGFKSSACLVLYGSTGGSRRRSEGAGCSRLPPLLSGCTVPVEKARQSRFRTQTVWGGVGWEVRMWLGSSVGLRGPSSDETIAQRERSPTSQQATAMSLDATRQIFFQAAEFDEK